MPAPQISQPEISYNWLDNNIRDLVKSLHLLDIITLSSCEGHIRKDPYHTGVIPWPWVIIAVTPEKMKLLQNKLDDWDKLNPQKKWILSERKIYGPLTIKYIKEMAKKDFPDCQVMALTPEEENKSLKEGILDEMQSQAIELAIFLQKPS